MTTTEKTPRRPNRDADVRVVIEVYQREEGWLALVFAGKGNTPLTHVEGQSLDDVLPAAATSIARLHREVPR